jgi:ADP-heptose:LPS heptosyltransferase
MYDRLLLLQPRWLGDVLLCTPAIREARRAFPRARIDFFTEPAGAEVLRGNPHLTDLLVGGRSIATRLQVMRAVRQRGYDAVVDFRSTGSTAHLAAISRAPVRIGVRMRGPVNLAYTDHVEPISLSTYAAHHKVEMLRRLGIDPDRVSDLSLELMVRPEARFRAADFWREHRLDHGPVVAVSVVSRVAYKNWGPAKWSAVISAISREGVRVLLTHGPGEAEQVARVVADGLPSGAVVYAGTSVEGLAAALERCVLWLGNDGGPKHVAVAMGVPTLTVSRWRIGPVWTDRDASVPHEFLERRPPGGCDLTCPRCRHLGCLAALESAEVVERALAAIARRSLPPRPRASNEPHHAVREGTG